MPDLSEPKFSLTMLVVDHTWLYCFGGVGDYLPENDSNHVIERLNTATLRDEDSFSEHNKNVCKWQRVEVKSKHQACCQQGVIILNQIPGSNERRYLVFGGVHGDYNNNTFYFHENLSDFSKSYGRDLTEEEENTT